MPTRQALLADLDAELRAGRPLTVVVMGLDRFKAVNDMVGNAAGDRFLVELSERLRQSAGRHWKCYRIGGDQFALLSMAASPDQCAIARLTASLAAPLRAGDDEFVVTASAGVVSYPADGRCPDELLRRVEMALSAAKRRGEPGAILGYDALLEATASQRLQLEQALRRALDEDRLDLHYQPKARTRGRSLAGAEALLRWRDPDRGVVPPDAFLPVAVACGLMTRIDQWVLQRAVRDARRLVDAGMPGRVAINLSADCLGSTQVVGWIETALREHGLSAGAIEVEITESSLMRDLEASRATLAAIRSLGVRIGVDDFGTGYSSLAYLTRFPVDVVKVDRQFVSRMIEDERSLKVVRGVIGLAHSLGMRVVAEGVETPAQIHALEGLDCDFVQGWALGRPMPLADLIALAHREPASAGLADHGAGAVSSDSSSASSSASTGIVGDIASAATGARPLVDAPPFPEDDLSPALGPAIHASELLDAMTAALAQADRLAAMPQVAPLSRALERVDEAARALRADLDRASERSALLGAALDRMDQGLMMVDARRVVRVCNRRARELLELPMDLMESRPRFEQVLAWQWARDEFVHTPESLKDFVRAGGILDTPHRYDRRRPDGRVIEVHSLPIEGGGVLRTYSDITERRRHEERIEWLARHDGLTGLVNRAGFLAAVQAAIEQACGVALPGEGTAAFTVCYLDLDRFKPINDRHGHAAGDAVLSCVSERMQRVAHESDVVGRLGGDEFAVLCTGITDHADALAFARRLRDAIAMPIDLKDGPVHVDASVGVALFPSAGGDVETLLHAADLALYSAKAAGGGEVRLGGREP